MTTHTTSPNNGDAERAQNVAEAVHAAVAAIYFDDSSDYLPALYSVVGHLAPHLAHELVSNPRSVWEQTDAARRSPVADAAGELPALGAEGLPPVPETLGEADLAYVMQTPDDWDEDYRSTWKKLQVADANRRQWRAYALQLRAQLARTSAPVGTPVGMEVVAKVSYWSTTGASGWDFKWLGEKPTHGLKVDLYAPTSASAQPADQNKEKN